MKVKILTDFSLGGGRDVFRGQTIDLDEKEAEARVRRGWAEYLAPNRAQYREPKVESREPAVGEGGKSDATGKGDVAGKAGEGDKK